MLWWTDISEFANPLGSRTYKVVLHLEALGPVLQKYVVDRSANLDALDVASERGVLLFNGVYLPREQEKLYSMGYRRVAFEARFTIEKNEKNLLFLRLRKFRVARSDGGRFDWLRLASRLYRGAEVYFLRSLVNAKSEVFSLPDEEQKHPVIVMNLDYFIRKAPVYDSMSMFGEISLVRALIRPDNRVHFYAQSNLILRRLAEYFGPQFIDIEEFRDRDHLEVLLEDEPL